MALARCELFFFVDARLRAAMGGKILAPSSGFYSGSGISNFLLQTTRNDVGEPDSLIDTANNFKYVSSHPMVSIQLLFGRSRTPACRNPSFL